MRKATDKDGNWIFDGFADEYDAVRNAYVPELIDDVLAYAALRHDDLVLEVGCGPGTATRQFAPRVPHLTAIEPGPRVAMLARRNTKTFGNVLIETALFDDWDGPGERFGLVFGARSFQWLDPATCFRKTAAHLRSAGALALFWHWPVMDGTGFFQDVQEAYDTGWPRQPDGRPPPPVIDRIEKWRAIIDAAPEFHPCDVRRYAWEREYDAETYIRLMRTWPDHCRLEDATREKLEAHIGRIIERAGGTVTPRYETGLFLTRRTT